MTTQKDREVAAGAHRAPTGGEPGGVGERGVQRHRVVTDDPEVARAHVNAMYAEHRPVLRGSGENFHFRTDVVSTEEVSISHVAYSVGVDITVDGGMGYPVVMHQRPGAHLGLSYGRGRERSILGDDDLFLVAPGHSYAVDWEVMDVTAIGLSAQLLEEDAALLTGHDQSPVVFVLGPPLSAAASGHWRQIQRFVTRNLTTNPQVAASPLARRELIRLLNGATVACFANSTQLNDQAPSIGAASGPVRRAVAYIHEHADTLVTLADLGAEARLSPRALQAAFRRQLDTTPLHYLRQVRLDRAHQDLQHATPGDGQTVTAIAARWGFSQPGRFARDYRSRYRTNPGDTLRRP